MDTVRLGRQVRALRRRRGWRQSDLAAAAHVGRSTISLVELGHAGGLSLAAVDAIAGALSARFDPRLLWNGEALDRLLDEDHAALVEQMAARLRRDGWEVAAEVTFAIGGERGSIDILAFHPTAASVLVVEVKSVVPDVQATLATHDRKSRLGNAIARDRGWRGTQPASRLLVVAESGVSRRRVAAHQTTFAAVYPVRGVELNRWLRSPSPARSVAGLLFLPGATHAVTRHRVRTAAAGSGARGPGRSSPRGSTACTGRRPAT